jgi:hypothetical protein
MSDRSRYTDPNLRDRLKDEIQQGDKGGKPGQWSARKAQLLAQRYESEGGGYVGERDEDQKSLAEWSAEEWQTVDASADADRGDGMHRYLPARAWELLSESERKQADKTKLKQDDGTQYADWPDAVRDVMTALGHTSDDPDSLTKDRLMEMAQHADVHGRSSMTKAELIEALAG